jgi:nucleoside-diphosphate-sugar epimerase
MRIALAGGTGFTGRRVAERLASRGDGLRCLVRANSDTSVLPAGVETVLGDLSEGSTLAAWLTGCETLVYTASMGFGHVAGVVEAAEAAGIRRAVFVSTTAIFTRLPAPSKAVRTAAEESVTGSALEWTIVRPTMIYGAPGDRNMERLLRHLARWPLVPLPGSGRSLIQPVHVDDLADGIAAATHCAEAAGRAFDLSGADALAFRDAIGTARTALGVRCARLGVPLAPVVGCLRLLEKLGLRPPIRSEQVLRLAEDKAFSHDDAARTFGFAPRPFAAGIAAEARLLGLVQGPGA